MSKPCWRPRYRACTLGLCHCQPLLGDAGLEFFDAIANGRLQRPDVAMPGQKIKTSRRAVKPGIEVGDETPERLGVLVRCRRDSIDG